MSYKVSCRMEILALSFLDGEIDMDVTEKAKEVILPLVESGKEVHLKFERCFIYGFFWNFSSH